MGYTYNTDKCCGTCSHHSDNGIGKQKLCFYLSGRTDDLIFSDINEGQIFTSKDFYCRGHEEKQ